MSIKINFFFPSNQLERNSSKSRVGFRIAEASQICPIIPINSPVVVTCFKKHSVDENLQLKFFNAIN